MASRSLRGNFFEDFSVGQRLAHLGGRTVTEGDAAQYLALTGDRYPAYCDSDFAWSLGYRRELINDLLVFHVVFGKTVADISLNAIANLGYADVRFLEPVYPGDTLRSETEIVGKRENKNGKSGIVYVKTRGLRHDGACVLEFYRWVMVRKHDTETRTGENEVPELPEAVSPDRLAADDVFSMPESFGAHAAASLGPSFFEDYAVGDEIQHGAGMTIEEAEHASATRLYQNTARVHFDGHAAKESPAGKRLMYGGHVISVARALSFNGLENAVRILAWNGGTHANPTYAGDTIYAFTDVLDCAEIPGRDDAGALRLRLIGVKNHDPSSESIEVRREDEETARLVYHGNVVLDLDYWVLMPKRPAG